jgi:class 3 adenylate cyclase
LCFSCGASLPGRPQGGGERRLVTVLFVDLVGFTGIAHRLDPEDLKRVIAPYFEEVRSEVERFGGHLEKYIGDAAMALFGAPVAYGDDPERAVRAAFRIRDAVAHMNESDPELDLNVRIGVNTGEAFVDVAADAAAGRGMAAGDVIVTCFRLQQAAPVAGILVGEGTHRATRRVVEYLATEAIVAKGKDEPVPAWSAVALRDAPGRPNILLFGREAELDRLRSLLVPPAAGGQRIVTLVGPPGMGKSRLLWELCEGLNEAEEPPLWRQGRCLSYGTGVSFSAFAGLVKSHAGILETDRADDVARKLEAAVAAAIEDEAVQPWVEAYLRPLVGLGGAERLSGDRRAEAFSAWRRFVEALALQRPLVLALEDVHWADDGLLDFVEHLADWAQGVPLAVFCTARPELLERRPRWPGVIQLEPLSTEDVGTLVDALLGRGTLGTELRAELLARAGGNPFYAEEFARLAQEQGVREDLRLPETIQATIAGRLDSLHPEARELLRDAAVTGTSFWAGALAHLSGLPHEQVERRLGELQWKELVRPQPRSAVSGESQYIFWHVLVRDVAYAQIPRADRADKHRLAAEWIESLAPDRADLTELLAHHYTSALEYARLARREIWGLEERARGVLRDAGEHALSLYNYTAAMRFFRETLALRPADDPERPGLLFSLGTALMWAERSGEPELASARIALLDAGDVACAARADVLLSRLALARGDRDAAAEHALGAVALLRDAPPTREQAEAVSNLAAFHALSGDSRLALEESAQALTLAEALGLGEIKAESLTFRGHARILGGDPGGIEDLEEAVEIAEQLTSPGLVRSCANLGTSLVELGQLERGWAAYERGRIAAQRFGDALGLHWLTAERPYELYWRGAWDDALAAAELALQEPDAAYGEYAGKTVRAWIRLARGDLAGALDDSAAGLEFARRTKDASTCCQALSLRARVLAEGGQQDEAARIAGEALELATEPGILASFWTADLADALHDLGRRDELAARDAQRPSRWLVAARCLLAGSYVEAADSYASIGARPEEAKARLRASAALLAAGQRADAERELERALAFYREVGADAYLRAAESLQVAPA